MHYGKPALCKFFTLYAHKSIIDNDDALRKGDHVPILTYFPSAFMGQPRRTHTNQLGLLEPCRAEPLLWPSRWFLHLYLPADTSLIFLAPYTCWRAAPSRQFAERPGAPSASPRCSMASDTSRTAQEALFTAFISPYRRRIRRAVMILRPRWLTCHAGPLERSDSHLRHYRHHGRASGAMPGSMFDRAGMLLSTGRIQHPTGNLLCHP